MGVQARRRIPREFEPGTESATIVTTDDLAGVEPVRSSLPLAEVLSTLSPLKEDFPRIPDPPSEPEDIL
ncbi:MAG: AbrB/MazE/SpoVT family DNA-binding domain-containing protein [Acidobacteriia bacterium]|nr:AbrB/MazE/SpoVT family DNA-binding domain-containing protein [Terriglobia bacterium]